MKTNTIAINIETLPGKIAARRDTTKVAVPSDAAFRRQQTFWNEVKKKILERNPVAGMEAERLY